MTTEATPKAQVQCRHCGAAIDLDLPMPTIAMGRVIDPAKVEEDLQRQLAEIERQAAEKHVCGQCRRCKGAAGGVTRCLYDHDVLDKTVLCNCCDACRDECTDSI